MMAPLRSTLSALFHELKRRRVFRVAGGYAIAAWIIIQVSATIFPALNLPSWSVTLAVVLALAGLPVALILAWMFDVTAEGVERTASSSSTAAPAKRRRMAIGASVLVVMLISAGWGLSRYRTSAAEARAAAQSVVAVFPFAVHASPAYAYLSEGLVDLLTARLNGLGDLRGVDPYALLHQAGGAPEPERAREVARRLGAGLYVLGSITEAGGRLLVTASLHDTNRRQTHTSSVEVPSENELVERLDGLVRDLLVERLPDKASGVALLAPMTTGSFTALKSYLRGESALRAARYDEALKAFQEAAAADSTFALAHFRIATTVGFVGREDLRRRAIGAALRHAQGLGEVNKSLLKAYDAYTRGDAPAALGLYHFVVGGEQKGNPTLVEAWQYLGETLYHLNPYYGRARSEAVAAFERALVLGPARTDILWHLLELSASARERARFDSIYQKWYAINTGKDDFAPRIAILRTLAFGSPAERRRMWDSIPAGDLWLPLMMAQSDARDLSEAERIARLASAPDAAPEARASMMGALAEVEIARGRWRSADSALVAARTAGLLPARVIVDRVRYAILPFIPATPQRLAAMTAEATHWDSAQNIPYVPPRLYRPAREYLLGHLAVRRGDFAEAEQHAAASATLAPNLQRDSLFANAFAASIRAHALHARSRPAEALTMIERTAFPIPPDDRETYPYDNQAFERYLRAEILLALGRDDEALGWFEALADKGAWESVYAAHAEYRLGQLAERQRRVADARRHFTRFVEFWKDADPELRPQVADAQQRMRRLTGN